MALSVDNPILQSLVNNQPEAGLEHFAALRSPTPEDRLWAGQLLAVQGNTHLAAIDQFALARSEGLEDAGVLLAELQLCRGDYQQVELTLASIDRAKLEPFGLATFEMVRAKFSQANGRLRNAVEHAQVAVNLSLADPVAALFLAIYAGIAADFCSRVGQDAKVEELIGYALPRAKPVQRLWLLLTRAVARMNQGQFELAQADLDLLEVKPVSIDDASSSDSSPPETHMPLLKSTVAYYTGQLARMRGLLDDAASRWLEATEIARDCGQREIECYAHLGLAWTATATENLTFARAHLARARHLADGLTLHAEIALAHGALLTRLNDGKALEMLEAALKGFELNENEREAGLAHLHLAEFFLRLDRTDEARAHLEQCLDARYALNCGVVFASELRALPAVFDHLSRQPTAHTKVIGYAQTMLEDWRALEHSAPAQVSLITLGKYQLLVDGQPVRLEAGMARTVELLSFMLEFGPAKLDDLQTGVFPDQLGQLSREYIHQIRRSVSKAIPSLTLYYDKNQDLHRAARGCAPQLGRARLARGINPGW
jgi:tetratricopeptide (TPR) repeat protein